MLVERMLFGRGSELRVIDELLEHVPSQGGALLVRGEAVVGKSALLAEAGRRAADQGSRSSTVTGVQSEAQLPFAGLHTLLAPVLGDIDALGPPAWRDALRGAFGSRNDTPDLFLVALAALGLISENASRQPILLLVDDAQRLDAPSCEVLTFVARRLESDPVAIVIAECDGSSTAFDRAGLPELDLDGLDEPGASALLDHSAPDLSPDARSRVLDAAGGIRSRSSSCRSRGVRRTPQLRSPGGCR
jgi:hypothetical protein